MKAYEMIQELAQYDADMEVHIQLEGDVVIEEPETGKELYGYVDNDTTKISGVYERNGGIYFDVSARI